MTPFTLFGQWFEEELKLTKVSIPSACCLSTIGTDGYPNARFVSLKGFSEDGFIITGTITSRKGTEIEAISKVALSFWWTATERQVRIQGNATRINAGMADRYFAERNRDSQIVSLASDQGQPLNAPEALNKKYTEIETEFAGIPITRPDNWGGYAIKPVRIEFLAFKPTRFHERKLFELTDGQWTLMELQP